MAGQAEKFIKGMNKDTARIDQIDGTFRDALNAVIDSDKGAITSEQGNSLVVNTKCTCGRVSTIVKNIIGRTDLYIKSSSGLKIPTVNFYTLFENFSER